jgi:hypothetical protein
MINRMGLFRKQSKDLTGIYREIANSHGNSWFDDVVALGIRDLTSEEIEQGLEQIAKFRQEKRQSKRGLKLIRGPVPSP